MTNNIVNWKKENLGIFAKYKHVLDGLACGLSEKSTKLDYIIVFIGIIISLLFAPSILNKGLLISVLLIFLATEYMNTAVETTIDRIGLEYHILSKNAKDLAAASAFIISIAVYILFILTIIHIIKYYKKWRRMYPKGTIWDYIQSTWN